MSEINRSLLILTFKQPFLDWARSLDDESDDLTLASLNEDAHAYLIPELFDDSDQEEFLESCYEILFTGELQSWWLEETAWPQPRDLKMFREWFEVEFHSLVFDLCTIPLERVEESDEDDDDLESTNGLEH